MAHGSAQDVTAKWLSRIQQAGPEMTAGVARVTQSPGAAAAAKRAKWVAALADPHTQDKWARNVSSVSLQQWQAAMNEYGINRVAQGANAKQAKFEAVMAQLLPYIDQGRSQVRAMDDSTFEARLQRSTAMQRWMHAFQRKPGA